MTLRHLATAALGRRHILVRGGAVSLLIATLCLQAQAQPDPAYRLTDGDLVQVASGASRLPVERSRIAVLDFRSIGMPESFGDAVAENLRNALVQQQHFTVVERAQIQQALKEQSFGHTGLVEADQAVTLGRMLGARVIVVGSVTKLAATYTINARFIDVQSGEAIDAQSLKTTNDNEIAELVDRLAMRLSGKVDDRTPQAARPTVMVPPAAVPVVLAPKPANTQPVAPQGQMVSTGKSRWAAAMLSVLLPGAGQYYNGNWGWGLLQTGLALTGAAAAAATGNSGTGGVIFFSASLWSIIDAFVNTEEETLKPN